MVASPQTVGDGGPAPLVPETISDLPVVVIEPSNRLSFRFREMWAFRELLYFLFWRDVKVRYKQTFLGAAWAIVQPVSTMIIFTIFLGRLAKMSSDNIPYSLFAFSGLLPWQLFSFSLNESASSLVNNKQLITKVYFPRILIPIAAMLVGLVDFLVASVVLVILMAYHRIVPTVGILLAPVLVLFAMVTALSIGLGLSALNVRYRDVRYTVPFIIQIWMFATPIVYPSSLVPERWRPVYGLNPMAGVVEGFRWALFGTSSGGGPLILVSIATVLVLLLVGLAYFQKTEKHFADLV